MADESNILGISGQIDITDIQSTIEKLCSSLQRVGVDAGEMSERMTKALNDIAKSDDDLASKTQQAMAVLKDAMSEAQKGAEGVPAMIKAAQDRVESIQNAIERLNTELEKSTTVASRREEITKQLEQQREALQLAKNDVAELTKSYAGISEVSKNASSTYESLNASLKANASISQAQSAANTTVSATASAATIATGTEAAAHTINAAAANANAQAENANAQATASLSSALQEYISTASGRKEIDSLQAMSTKRLREEIKLYEDAIKEIKKQLENTDYAGKIEKAQSALEHARNKVETLKASVEKLTQENADPLRIGVQSHQLEEAQKEVSSLSAYVEELQHRQQTLNGELDVYNAKLEAAKAILNGETVVLPSVDSGASYEELKKQLEEAQNQLKELGNEAQKFEGIPLGAKQRDELAQLNEKIEQTKEQIKTIKESLQEKNESTFSGRAINRLSELKEKISELGSNIKEKLQEPFERLSNKVGNSSFGQRFSAEFSSIRNGIESANSSISNFLLGNGKVQENLNNLSKAMGSLGIPISGALTGIKAVTKALWSMCATPIGAILTVIVLGLKAVHTWMTKSAEGQKVYTKLMAYLGSLAASVTDIVITLGGWLYHCFADANGPLRDFGANLINTFKYAGKAVYNILGGIGNVVKGIFTADWDTMKKGASDLWNGIQNAGNAIVSAAKTQITGITGALKTIYAGFTDNKLQAQLSSQLSGMTARAAQAAELAGKQQEAEIEISKARKTQADLDIKIADNREKIYKLTGKAKDALIEETKALQRQKYDSTLNAQKQLLSYQQQRMKLHTVSLQDIAKERELSVDILRTEAQRAASTRMLTRMQEANRRSMERQGKNSDKTEEKQTEQTQKAQEKYSNILYSNDDAREKVITNLETKIADARVAAMQEGFEKTQAERKRQQEKELQQLKNQENEAIAAELKRVKAEFDAQNAIRKARGQSLFVWDNDKELSNIEHSSDVIAIRKSYSQLRQLTVNRQIEDERSVAANLVKSHQSYRDKLIDIDKQYQRDLQAINEAITDAQNRGDQEQVQALQRTRNKRASEYAKESMQASFDELKNSPDYAAAFSDIDKASTKTLNSLVNRFEEVKQAAASSLNPQDAKSYFDTVNSLIDELIKRDPVGMAKQLTKQLESQRQELERNQIILQSLQNGAESPIAIKSWDIEMENDQVKLVPVYYTLDEAQKMVATSGQAVAHTEKQIESACKKTLDYVQQLTSAFNKLGNAIGGEAGQIIGLISDIGNFAVSSANAMLSVSTTASKAIQTLEKASAILTIVSGTIGIMSKISSLFKSSDDYYEKYAKKQRDINNLREAVEEYQMAVLKAKQAEKNWFSSTGLQALQDAWETHAKAEENYYNKLFEAQERYKDKSSGLSKIAVPVATTVAAVAAGAITGGLGSAVVGALGSSLGSALAATVVGATVDAVAGYTVGTAAQSAINKISYKNNQTAAVDNLRIQTRHKSFWRGQKTQDLRSWVRGHLTDDEGNPAELFDEQGMINLEVAQTVVDKYGKKLQGETQETLEKLIKLREQYDDYKKELQNYVSETYSPLVDNMSDAIWSWLSEGKDALQQFKESASKTFADIGKEMIKQMLLKSVFNGFQEKLTDLYDKYARGEISETQLAAQMGTTMGDTMQAAEKELPAIETFAKQYSAILSKYGFDVTGNIEQSASGKGVSSITYDQANLLTNLATARNIALEKGNEVRQQILDAINELVGQNIAPIVEIPKENAVDQLETSIVETPLEKTILPQIPTVAIKIPQEWMQIVNLNQLKAQYSNRNGGIEQFTNNVPDISIIETKMLDALNDYLSIQPNKEAKNNGDPSLIQTMSVDTSLLRTSVLQMQSDVSVMRDIQEQGLTQITKIETNTRPINEILAVLQDLYKITKDNI